MIKNLKIIAVISALLFIGVIPLKAQFTPGNIVIERLGDAVYPSGTSNAVPIYLDEYTTTGTYVQTVALPTTTANGNYMITENGSAAKSALMSRSANGQYICISGYMDTINAVNVSNTSTGGPDFIPRNVATVDYNGNINSTTLIYDTYSGGKIRSVASVDGTHFWTSGNSGAIRYMALGSIGNTTPITTAPTNSNALDIFNGQLYNSGDHSPTIGLSKVGVGYPTTTIGGSGHDTTLMADTNSTSPFQFVWLVLSPGDTVCYVANQLSGGLVKYSWRNDSLIKCGGINGVYVGVTGTVNCAGNVELFYSTSSSTSSNSVLKYIDSTGYMGRMHTFSQPAFIWGITNYFFKGIKFCPYQDLTITSSQTIAAGSYNNITISSGGVATLSGNIKIVGTLTVNSGGTLICGAHNVVGNSDFQNAFVLNSGATLEMGSAAGITASAASGNIQTCARVYSTGANYIYNGTVNQVTGNGLPATVNNLTIANTGSAGNDTVHLTAGVTVTNDLTITSGVLDVSSNNYSITVDSSFYNNASFSAEAGTVTFNGSVAENFLPGSSSYYNVVINNTGNSSVYLESALTAANNITISNGTLDVTTSNYPINVAGNFTNNSAFASESGTVTFNGSGSQSFTPGSSNYYNTTINTTGGGTVTLAGNLTNLHDITITTGTLDVSSSNYSITVKGSFYNNATFNAEYAPLTFNGTANENFLPGSSNFYAVVVNNTGSDTVKLQSNLTVNNNLTITSGTFDVSTNDYSVNVAGNLTNGAHFDAETGTVTFNGSGSETFNPGTSSFYNVVVSNTGGGTVTLAHNLTVTNNLTINSGGTFDVSASNYLITIYGDLYNYGTFNAHTGTVDFVGNNGQLFYGGSSNFYNVIINCGNFVALASNLSVSAYLTIDAGILDASSGNYSITVGMDFTNNSQFNAEGGTLSVAGSLYDESYFNSQTGTVILNGSSTEYFDDLNYDLFNNVTINNSSGGVYLTDYLFIGGVLNCQNGALYMNGSVIEVIDSSANAIVQTNGFVVSDVYYTTGSDPDVQVDNTTLSFLEWTINSSIGTFIFPLGTPSGQYIPYAVKNTAGHNLGTVAVATWNAPYNSYNTSTLGPLPYTVPNLLLDYNENSDNVVKRFWQLSKSGSDPVAAMTFTCANSEAMNNANTVSITNLFPQRWNGASWDSPLAAGTPLFTIPGGAVGATVINIPNFSPWALAGNNHPLPIELFSFGAEYLNTSNIVKVSWETVAEINNNYFTVQRTADGTIFNDLGKVNGAGNSNSPLYYSFDDDKPLTGLSYYRLKQTDFDGNFTYSKLAPIAINNTNSESNNSISIYPDPSDNSTLLSFNGTANEAATLEISDIRGALISTTNIQSVSGINLYRLNTQTLTDGIYFINIKSSSTYQIQKLCVRH